jgi:hypothetical protein
MRSPIFQSLPPIMGETITGAALFEVWPPRSVEALLAAYCSRWNGDTAPWLQHYFFRE